MTHIKAAMAYRDKVWAARKTPPAKKGDSLGF
jgi:hypothetical protein